MKQFYLQTFGCQMNKSDSDLMRHSLILAGYSETDKLRDADIALYNTCSVREHAEKRAIAIITANNAIIRRKGGTTVIAGCMAQRIGLHLLSAGIADIVVGPYQSPLIANMLNEYDGKREPFSRLSMEADDFCDRIPRHHPLMNRELPWHEWVTVSHGCDNLCSYCIVPFVRGKLISFPSTKIIELMRSLHSRGIREITLLGQNVNQYGSDSADIPFHRLLEESAKIGFQKINFITSHPKDFSEEIIMVIRDHANISRSIHLPLQSGSDRILALMNREYSLNDYMRIVDSLHRHLEPFALSTDLIVGFPGETTDEYARTIGAVKAIEFDEAFMYAYSPREGTPAFTLGGQITKDEKRERLTRLISDQRAISAKKLEGRINAIEETIIERMSKKSDQSVMGKTFLNHPVVIPGSIEDIGKMIRIQIHGIRGSTLQGTRIA